MENLFLKKFLNNIGESVHNLNTICVALNGLKAQNFTKPDDMHIRWAPADINISAARARHYAQKSAIIYAVESFYSYVENIKVVLLADKLDGEFFNKKIHNAEKYAYFFKSYNDLFEEYIGLMIILLIHWRNKIVHLESNSKLSSQQQSILLKNSEKISEKYAGLNIQETLKHFENNEPTLKDVSTLIAICISGARRIDKLVISKINSPDKLLDWISASTLSPLFFHFSKLKKDETQKRKIKTFLKIYFSSVDQSVKDEFISMELFLKTAPSA